VVLSVLAQNSDVPPVRMGALYPVQARLRDGTAITIRPIGPPDTLREQAFMQALSPQSRYFRFMSTLRELPPDMLYRFTHPDVDREVAFEIAPICLGLGLIHDRVEHVVDVLRQQYRQIDAPHIAAQAQHGRQTGGKMQVGSLILDGKGEQVGNVHL